MITNIQAGIMPDSFARNLVTAVAGEEDEMCGFIFNNWSYTFVRNVAAKPSTSFFMEPQRQLELVRQYKDEIIGVFHSHPGGSTEPSPDDVAGWNPQMPWRYFIVAGGRVLEFERNDSGDVSCIASKPS